VKRKTILNTVKAGFVLALAAFVFLSVQVQPCRVNDSGSVSAGSWKSFFHPPDIDDESELYHPDSIVPWVKIPGPLSPETCFVERLPADSLVFSGFRPLALKARSPPAV